MYRCVYLSTFGIRYVSLLLLTENSTLTGEREREREREVRDTGVRCVCVCVCSVHPKSRYSKYMPW